jgi:hypothetical protein
VLQRNVAFGNEGFLFAQQNPDIKIICIFSFPWLFSPSERVLQSYWIFEEPKASQTKAKKRGGSFKERRPLLSLGGPVRDGYVSLLGNPKLQTSLFQPWPLLPFLDGRANPKPLKRRRKFYEHDL